MRKEERADTKGVVYRCTMKKNEEIGGIFVEKKEVASGQLHFEMDEQLLGETTKPLLASFGTTVQRT